MDMIVTNYGVFKVEEDGLVLTERAEDVSVEEIRAATEADFRVSPNLTTIG